MVALSETMRLEYLRIGVSAERLTTIPNAVNLARFHGPTNREETRERYGLTRNGFCFPRRGTQPSTKRLSNNARSDTPTAPSSKATVRLVIAGRDVHKLEPEVNRRGLQDIVRLAEIGVEQRRR